MTMQVMMMILIWIVYSCTRPITCTSAYGTYEQLETDWLRVNRVLRESRTYLGSRPIYPVLNPGRTARHNNDGVLVLVPRIWEYGPRGLTFSASINIRVPTHPTGTLLADRRTQMNDCANNEITQNTELVFIHQFPPIPNAWCKC